MNFMDHAGNGADHVGRNVFAQYFTPFLVWSGCKNAISDFGSHQKWCEPRKIERSCVAFHTISGVVRMQKCKIHSGLWISGFSGFRITPEMAWTTQGKTFLRYIPHHFRCGPQTQSAYGSKYLTANRARTSTARYYFHSMPSQIFVKFRQAPFRFLAFLSQKQKAEKEKSGNSHFSHWTAGAG